MSAQTQNFLEAVKAGNVEEVRPMLKADATLASAKDDAGNSAILLAIYYGRKDIVELLLAHDLDLTIFEAAAAGKLDRVEALAEDDPGRVNAFSHDGFTPIGLAAFFGRVDVVRYLLSTGAEVNAVSKNRMRVMPLHSAVAGRHLSIARMLIEHGADVNVAQQDGFTPLHGAAQNGQEEMVTLLLDRGAQVDAKAADGKTPLAFAAEEGHEVVADVLRRHGALD